MAIPRTGCSPSSGAQIRGVLFDFGGVVLRTPFELIDDWERRTGAPHTPARGPFSAPGEDVDFEAVGEGTLTERSYWLRRSLAAEPWLVPSDEDPTRRFIRAVYAGPESHLVRGEVLHLLDELDGLHLGVLTNDLHDFHGQAWVDDLTVLDRFAFVVDGSLTGVLKPDRRAYQIALEHFDLPAEHVLFVDDQPVNLTGAERVGLRTLRFDPTDPQASCDAVRSIVTGAS